METVTITSVTKNDRGWTEVQTEEYDEPLVTKDTKVVKAIEAVGEGRANVEVNVKPNGSFINRYLNGIEAANGASLPAPEPSPEVAAVQQSKRDERAETQARIQAQWAIGRAVELATGEGLRLDDLLDTDTFSKVQAVAETLLTASKALADKS